MSASRKAAIRNLLKSIETGDPAGLAAVDDAARAAVVYLRHFERTADPSSRQEALGLLTFVTAMEGGDGEFLNFVHADGSPNRAAPTSRKSFSYWAARALWAMGRPSGS